jgi:hypothetical protein
MVAVWLIAVFDFNKWGATWWGVSIFVPGALLIALICVVEGFFFKHFSADPINPLPDWLLIVVVIYYFLCLGLGVFFTEAGTNGGIPRSALAQEQTGQTNYHDDDYRYSRTGSYAYTYIFVNNSTTPSPSYTSISSSSHCTGKSCSGLGIALLLIIFLILLLTSAFIPHFWVVGMLLAIVLFVLYTRREYAEAGF